MKALIVDDVEMNRESWSVLIPVNCPSMDEGCEFWFDSTCVLC